jgi:hypothetical protein
VTSFTIRHARPLTLLAAALLLSTSACTSSSGGGTDGGTTATDGGSDTTDGGGADGGISDGKCRKDEDCKVAEYCQVSTGVCLNAKGCTTSQDCDTEDETDYCAYGKCFCDPDRAGGRCRPRFSICSACTRDVECGGGSDEDNYLYEKWGYSATCVADGAGVKSCLPTRNTRCPPGYIVTTTSPDSCQPAGGSCAANAPCTSDAECDPMGSRPICNTDRGFCIPACTFAYQAGESRGCPSGQVCHVDPRLLTANNPNFGGGRCGAPCDSGATPYECAAANGIQTACVPDGDPLTSSRPLRCRPASPACVWDQDCPRSDDAHSKGYCDTATLTCQNSCRPEREDELGLTSDCIQGYKCLNGACVQKTCIEGGGAILACSRGQFCCGEADSPSCPPGVNRGACYDPPNPPWCGECEETATTPDGSSTRPQYSKCVRLTDGNDIELGRTQWHACEKSTRSHCPSNWGCNQNIQFCSTDGECGGGTDSCATITIGQTQTGPVNAKGCTCSKDTGVGCPAPSTCGCTCPGPNGTCKPPSDPTCLDRSQDPAVPYPANTPVYTGVCMAYWCDNNRGCQ